MTVIWSAEAQAQLAAIDAHVARDSPQNAEALIRRLVDRASSTGNRSPKRSQGS